MAECECLPGCPFYNDKMANKPSTAKLYKNKYCLDDFESCARYRVFKAKGKSAVPADLFPNQVDQAEMIINS